MDVAVAFPLTTADLTLAAAAAVATGDAVVPPKRAATAATAAAQATVTNLKTAMVNRGGRGRAAPWLPRRGRGLRTGWGEEAAG